MLVLLKRFWPHLAFAAVVASILLACFFAGRHVEALNWEAREARIGREVAEQRLEDERRVGKLALELEGLKSRPEKIRTVTREVVRRVKDDRQCPSLPADWRVLWSASADPATAAAAGVADAATAPVAPTARVDLGIAAEAVAEARARFETCTGQLTGLQAYVRDVVRPE